MREYFERCAPGQAGVDAGRLLELCRELQKPQYGLHALMFLRQGKVIYESYFAPFRKACLGWKTGSSPSSRINCRRRPARIWRP